MEWIKTADRLPTPEECKKYEGWFLILRKEWPIPELSRYDREDSNYEHGWKYGFDSLIVYWRELPSSPAGWTCGE